MRTTRDAGRWLIWRILRMSFMLHPRIHIITLGHWLLLCVLRKELPRGIVNHEALAFLPVARPQSRAVLFPSSCRATWVTAELQTSATTVLPGAFLCPSLFSFAVTSPGIPSAILTQIRRPVLLRNERPDLG